MLSFLILVTLMLNSWVILGRNYSGDAAKLNFPLIKGKYVVLQGGKGVLTNPFHQVNLQSSLAIDIVKLGSNGNRATKLFPTELSHYHIYTEEVISPCSGKVISTVSDIADNIPPFVNKAKLTGNHIVLKCNHVKVLIAHLKFDSLRVAMGDDVSIGQVIAEVGNSGYSNEPHLHIQANTEDGNALAMFFGNRFLSVNDVVEAD